MIKERLFLFQIDNIFGLLVFVLRNGLLPVFSENGLHRTGLLHSCPFRVSELQIPTFPMHVNPSFEMLLLLLPIMVSLCREKEQNQAKDHSLYHSFIWQKTHFEGFYFLLPRFAQTIPCIMWLFPSIKKRVEMKMGLPLYKKEKKRNSPILILSLRSQEGSYVPTVKPNTTMCYFGQWYTFIYAEWRVLISASTKRCASNFQGSPALLIDSCRVMWHSLGSCRHSA